MNPSNKIAFYIADKRHFDYFVNVIDEVKKAGGEVMLVINDTRSQGDVQQLDQHYTDEMAQLANERGLPYIFSLDAINSGTVFSLIVSTFSYTYKIPHGKKRLKRVLVRNAAKYLGKPLKNLLPRFISEKIAIYTADDYPINRWEYPEHLLAKRSVFFPKGLDVSDDYPNPVLRKIADYYFCHGEYDKKIMEKNIGKEIFEIGYPRYDKLNNLDDTNQANLITEFGMDESKPLICWIPTYVRDKRNILEWIPHFKALKDSYNLLIRPHPKQIERDDGSLSELLKETGFYIDLQDDREMTQLYTQARLICCDYGGTIFSAIYIGANLLLLNLSDHDSIAAKRNKSADIRVREKLFNLSPDEAVQSGGLQSVISDQNLTNTQSEQLKLVRKEYFGDVNLGEGSNKTAKKLLSLIS